MEAPTVGSKQNENEIQTFVEGIGEELYQINFLNKNDKILIKCHDTSKENEITYSYKLTDEEIRKTTSCLTTTHFINQIQPLIDNSKIEKIGNFILLHILLDRNKKEFKTIKLEESSEEEELEGDINNLEDAIKVIKILVKENKKLKNKLNCIENEFMNYKNEMKLNFTYNSLDINSYKLDNIFKTLSCRDIIQNRDEFGLINSGFQQLFKKNIVVFEGIFKSKNNESNYQEISSLFNNYNYLVIVILTKDNKRFGAFYEKNNNNYNQMNVINNNYPVANQNNNNMVRNIKPPVFNGGNLGYGLKLNNLNPLQRNNLLFKQNNLNNLEANNIRLNQNNNILMNQNINNTINIPNKNIFNSSSPFNDYFVFSLDELKIFYCNNQEKANNPQFSIFYDANRQTLYGQEVSRNNQFKLSGKKEFNIKDFELYNVEIGKL